MTATDTTLASSMDLAQFETMARNLLAASEETGVQLPAELDLAAVHTDRYAGDPLTQLKKRMRMCGYSPWEHREALEALTAVLRPAQVWDAFVADFTGAEQHHAKITLTQLIKTGLLPAGNSLLVAMVGNIHPGLHLAAIDAALELEETNPSAEKFTAATLIDFAFTTGMVANDPVTVFNRAAETGNASYDAPVRFDSADLAGFVRVADAVHAGGHDERLLATKPRWRRAMTTGQVHFLLRKDTGMPTVLTCLALCQVTGEPLLRHLTDTPGALRLLALVVPPELNCGGLRQGYNDTGTLLEQAVTDRPEELLGLDQDTARFLRTHVDLDALPEHVFLDVLARGKQVVEWLNRDTPRNEPTTARVRAARDAGLITGWNVSALQYSARQSPWYPELVATVPGVAAAFVEAARTQDRFGIGSLNAMLPIVAGIIGDGPHAAALWQRLLATGGAEGPFKDKSIADAIALYRDRWEQAAARTR